MASSTKRCWKLQDFVAHGASVNCLALGHKSGRVLVTGGDDKKVNLWAVGKHNCFMSLSGHTTPVECVQFGHTDELVCAGSQSGALKIWDLEAAKIVRTLTGHKSSIRCIDFHPYGDFLASGSQDTSIKLWDIRRKGCIFTYKGHKMMVNSLKFSPDGQWVASGGEEGHVKLWDLRAGRLLKEFSQHCGSVSAVKFHPNEFLLASSSADRTVNFWDLEKFQLISTSDKDVGPVRCISFSENGECLFAGSQESLKVYGWEPTRTFDTVPISWGKIQDIAIAQNQLIGASFHLTNVILHVIDLSKVQPFGGLSKSDSPPFIHGHSFRKSFSRDRPANGAKTRLDVKTIEEAERSGTDPEDESQSLADIKIVGDYQSIFKPHRSLNRTPPPEPFPAPLEDANSMSLPDPFPVPLIEDPMVPQILHPSTNDSQMYQSSPSLNNFDTTEAPKSQEQLVESPKLIDQPQIASLRSVVPNLSLNKLSYQRLNSCKDTSEFPELDFPVKLNNIRHSPSDPMLNRPNSSHSRSHSLNRNFVPVNNNNSNSSKVESFLNTTTLEKSNTPTTSSSYKPSPQPPVSSRPSPLARVDSEDMLDEEPQKEVTFVPCKPNRSSGLNLDDFLPKSHSTPIGYQKSYPNLSEEDTIRCLVQGHRPMVTVLDNRFKCLQIILALWKNKDLKTALESALDMKDQGIVVDLLSFLIYRQKSWNLDVCGLVLPAIYELLQSRFEWYMTVGCNTLRFILVNFASVIRTNILAPVHSVGVDISREERYKKCLHCYQNLMTIRAFLLKRQTMQGKLGQMFRELHNLMQSLD